MEHRFQAARRCRLARTSRWWLQTLNMLGVTTVVVRKASVNTRAAGAAGEHRRATGVGSGLTRFVDETHVAIVTLVDNRGAVGLGVDEKEEAVAKQIHL